jgi:beta-galactosidase
MNPDAIKAEAGIATALIRVGKSLNGSLSAKSQQLKSTSFSIKGK